MVVAAAETAAKGLQVRETEGGPVAPIRYERIHGLRAAVKVRVCPSRVRRFHDHPLTRRRNT